ncbi:NAD(P)-dependent oxidoreductase [Silvibacterium dinghuense]|uniref:NAD(P)-dependent oxidoreductase n=1 Tax=Silvibacterium dinghuense TaxID=1560006 RepID=A0A4Q1SGR5_9BACT|nr:NAD(P)-dependent oxidoreductase [Silvibacterium dinghuense]RXS96704.1 NAD(P)-dependent oxidoreductase [Silvibacterium dinghuense]GGG92999.1 3-hydroxyisobutyrate dehydrogenase [Silvibacterium dinghuense]
MTKIAFLGLGAMGSRMAKNILDAGFELTVWNRTASAAEDLVKAGARQANSPKSAADGAEIVIAMVTDDVVSSDLWTDEATGALAGMNAGSIAVEMSTLTPEWVAKLKEKASARGVALVDAPVSGSLPQAEGRQLVVMAGGDTEAFETVKPVLSAIGPTHHVGASGQGAALKLAVNALMGIQITAWAEMLGFLGKQGLDTHKTMDLLATMPVCSPLAAGMSRLMLAQDYAPRFTNALLAKDFRYFKQTTGNEKTPIADAASAVYQRAAEEMGHENVTAVIRFYE